MVVVVVVVKEVVIIIKDPSGTRTSSGRSSRWRKVSALCNNCRTLEHELSINKTYGA